MINEQIIIDTIKRMVDSGIDDATIVSTLKEIGLSEQDSVQMIGKVKSPSASQTNSSSQENSSDASSVASQENNSEPQMEMMRNELETQAQKDELQDATTYNMLNMHEQKIDEMSSKVDEVKQVISSVKQGSSDASLTLKVNEIEAKVDEIDAQVKAVFEVMKNILETDRKILVELESKK